MVSINAGMLSSASPDLVDGMNIHTNNIGTRIMGSGLGFAMLGFGAIVLRLSSEAAQRFGRGMDSELTLPALLRASRLMEEVSGGKKEIY